MVTGTGREHRDDPRRAGARGARRGAGTGVRAGGSAATGAHAGGSASVAKRRSAQRWAPARRRARRGRRARRDDDHSRHEPDREEQHRRDRAERYRQHGEGARLFGRLVVRRRVVLVVGPRHHRRAGTGDERERAAGREHIAARHEQPHRERSCHQPQGQAREAGEELARQRHAHWRRRTGSAAQRCRTRAGSRPCMAGSSRRTKSGRSPTLRSRVTPDVVRRAQVSRPLVVSLWSSLATLLRTSGTLLTCRHPGPVPGYTPPPQQCFGSTRRDGLRITSGMTAKSRSRIHNNGIAGGAAPRTRIMWPDDG